MTPDPPDRAQWYINIGGKVHGPISPHQLRNLAETKRITPETRIIRDGMSDWMRAGSLRGLFPSATVPVEAKEHATWADQPEERPIDAALVVPVTTYRPHIGRASTDWLGIVSNLTLLIGIGSLFISWWIGWLAVILGIVAFTNQDSASRSARRCAIAGIILGAVSTSMLAGRLTAVPRVPKPPQLEQPRDLPPPQLAPSLQEQIFPEHEQRVTMAEYSRIRTRMSYWDVVDITGELGEEISSVEIAGIRTKMYIWKNDDFSNMNATFQDDELISKAQFGLK